MNNFMYFNSLKNKIKKKKIRVAIVGLGYVGLQLAIQISKKKIQVFGIDTDKEKINSLKKKKSFINYINDSELKFLNTDNFSSNFSHISKTDIIIYCLPTPLKLKSKPDLSFIKNASNQVKKFIKPGQLLISESTSYPGTTEDFIYQKLNLKKFKIGENFFLGFSPEREDPGNKKFNIRNIPKVVSGKTENCLFLINNFYKLFVKKTVLSPNIKTAETSKLLENIYRAVNISLVNELKYLTTKVGVDIFDVVNLAKTKPFGFQAFYPGPGLGGHCLPVDPFYLSYFADSLNVSSEFIKLSGKINHSIPIKILITILKEIKSNKIKKNNFLVLGVTYKKNIDDIRESPGIKILNLLIKKFKKNIYYSDPYVPLIQIQRKTYKSISLNKKNLNKIDFVILVTDHDKFNYKLIFDNSKKIIDTRGRYKMSKKVIRA